MFLRGSIGRIIAVALGAGQGRGDFLLGKSSLTDSLGKSKRGFRYSGI